MSAALIFTVIIVMVIYFYLRRMSNRRRAASADIDSVRQYHDQYKRRRTHNSRLHGNGDPYRAYVTKYNSNEDYRERQGR